MVAKVHMFTSTPGEMDTNSFLIETAASVVAIDTQFLGTPARQFRAMLDAIGKPLRAVVITHPHPDHFNGTDVFLEGLTDIPILSTRETLAGIHACATKVRDKWLPMYGEEYPVITRFPNVVIGRKHTLTFDGTDIIIDSIGPGEAVDISIVYVPESRDLILGDVLYDRTHAWILEQHSREWLVQLEDIKTRYAGAKTVYSGHGGSGPMSMLDEQAAYIRRFREIVADGASDNAMTPKQKSAVVARIKKTYPDFKQDWWVAINVDAMARELGVELRKA
jgi:glyoxylase-like metal-dependent hydrolase (beta-lactamase superfamily II)